MTNLKKPKFKIGDVFTSNQKGDVKIINCYFDEKIKDFVYAVEFVDFDMMLYTVYLESDILLFLGE